MVGRTLVSCSSGDDLPTTAHGSQFPQESWRPAAALSRRSVRAEVRALQDVASSLADRTYRPFLSATGTRRRYFSFPSLRTRFVFAIVT